MDLRWLEDFVSLAETASFSQAAKRRNMTQPAFSRRIKQLELWVGVSLVSRAHHPPALTPEGQRFLPQARELVAKLHRARTGLHQDDAPLRLAVSAAMPPDVLPWFLDQITPALPGLSLRELAPPPDPQGALAAGQLDLWLTLGPDAAAPARRIGHRVWRPVLAPALMPEGCTDLFARPQAVPWLSQPPDSPITRGLQRLEAGAPLRHVLARDSSLLALARAGQGLCWLPEQLIAGDLAAGRLVLASPDRSLTLAIVAQRAQASPCRDLDRIWQLVQALG